MALTLFMGDEESHRSGLPDTVLPAGGRLKPWCQGVRHRRLLPPGWRAHGAIPVAL